MAQIHVDSRKWRDRPHWQFSTDYLGEDEHGAWLHAPAGTVAQRGDEPPRAITAGFVGLAPHRAWWFVDFYWDHPLWTMYVNIATPCEWHGDRVTQIDLDLDVVRTLDGAVEILDEDEFIDHQVRYEYPQNLIDGALAATETAVNMLEQTREPFAVAADRWLNLVATR
jgi:hypothetical protein